MMLWQCWERVCTFVSVRVLMFAKIDNGDTTNAISFVAHDKTVRCKLAQQVFNVALVGWK
jgi:hypothetical protein